jgi:hypothetical protein
MIDKRPIIKDIRSARYETSRGVQAAAEGPVALVFVWTDRFVVDQAEPGHDTG